MFDLAVIGLAVVFIAIGLMRAGRRLPPLPGPQATTSTNGNQPATKKKSNRMIDRRTRTL